MGRKRGMRRRLAQADGRTTCSHRGLDERLGRSSTGVAEQPRPDASRPPRPGQRAVAPTRRSSTGRDALRVDLGRRRRRCGLRRGREADRRDRLECDAEEATGEVHGAHGRQEGQLHLLRRRRRLCAYLDTYGRRLRTLHVAAAWVRVASAATCTWLQPVAALCRPAAPARPNRQSARP